MNRPYSEATRDVAARAIHAVRTETQDHPERADELWEYPVYRQAARASAEAALDALAAADRLLPEGAETRTEREELTIHLDILAKRLRGFGVEVQRPVQALAEQLRSDALAAVVIGEPGPDVQVVLDPFGNKVRRGRSGGWVWWGGRSGNRPEWSWEKVRDGFGPLVLPPQDESDA